MFCANDIIMDATLQMQCNSCKECKWLAIAFLHARGTLAAPQNPLHPAGILDPNPMGAKTSADPEIICTSNHLHSSTTFSFNQSP